MYTVIWQEKENGKMVDKWDRFSSREEVLDLLDELEEKGVYLQDTWVFMPAADEYATESTEFVQ